ncbi:divergent PAP2 family protein [Salinispira pacifica]
MHGFPSILIAAGVVQVTCQLFKLVFYSIRDGRMEWRYLTTAGGIPSAHSAFVTTLSVLIALKDGIGSDIFAVTAAFSAIVIFDAYRLRGHVQQQTVVVNRLLDRLEHHEETRMTEMIGHSIPEIGAGILVGGVLGLVAHFIIG